MGKGNNGDETVLQLCMYSAACQIIFVNFMPIFAHCEELKITFLVCYSFCVCYWSLIDT